MLCGAECERVVHVLCEGSSIILRKRSNNC